jgi:xanthine/uracil permease
MVAMAILIGLVVGIAYFHVTAKVDLSALTVPSWVLTIIDRFNGLIG